MARIVRRAARTWENYHQTLRRISPDWRALVAQPAAGQGPAAYFRATAQALQGLVAECARDAKPILTLGSAWSFSRILSGPGVILDTRDAAALFRIPSSMQAGGDDRRLVLCHGGTPIRELNKWLLSQGLSLFTSGAHDGQTVAGACGTGTHGSAVQFGGFQNHVRGVHLVTGPDSSLWLEPEPLLAPTVSQALADVISTDREYFDAALVHLGGCGVVNAVLLEVSDDFRVAVVRRKTPMTPEWMRMLEQGAFHEFARAVWPEAPAPYPDLDPYYVEVILNPFAEVAPVGSLPRPALISIYYRRPVPQAPALYEGPPLDDVLDLIRPSESLLAMPWLLPEAVTLFFGEEPDGTDAPRLRTWGKANGKHTRLVDLYNAAYAIPRERLSEALRVMKEAFLARGPDAAGPLVFTLRFVHRAAGLLAFTQFDDTVVVNMDGLRERASERSAEDVSLALELAGIPFRQHWAKLGVITPKRLRDGYGDPDDPTSLAGRWKVAREAMLDPRAWPIFASDALRDWSLVD